MVKQEIDKKLKQMDEMLTKTKFRNSSLIMLSLCMLLTSGFTTKNTNRNNNSENVNYTELVIEQYDEYLDKYLKYVSSEEKLDNFLKKYNVQYLDMIKAVTKDVWGVDYSAANVIRNREDFPEMASEFKKIADEKLTIALEKYSMTYPQFEQITQRMLNESGGYIYEEVCNVWAALLNRLYNSTWINYVSRVTGQDGYHIYTQFMCPGQFGSGAKTPSRFDVITDWIGYYAALDVLCSDTLPHNYVGFRANYTNVGVQLYPEGNRYCSPVEHDVFDNPTIKEVKPKEHIKLIDLYKSHQEQLFADLDIEYSKTVMDLDTDCILVLKK